MMTQIEARFTFQKETKGAVRYQEVDKNGDAFDQA
jgi:hypothetical protein